MPNYCLNRLTFEGSDNDILTLMDSITKVRNGKSIIGTIDFERIIPIPENIYMGDLDKDVREKYGRNNWFDWCNENWNTKWNALNCDIVDDNIVEFTTAWSPPEPVIQKLSEKFPDVKIEHSYYEGGCGIIGINTYLNGEIIDYDEPDEEEMIELFDIVV